MSGGDLYSLMQEAYQKATKDAFCFLSGRLLEDCEPMELTIDLPVGTGVLPIYNNLGATEHLIAQATFNYGSGGTSAKFYIQSSLDLKVSWFDVLAFEFEQESSKEVAVATLDEQKAIAITDGTLNVNQPCKVMGDVFRVKYIIVGAYVNTTVSLTGIAKSF